MKIILQKLSTKNLATLVTENYQFFEIRPLSRTGHPLLSALENSYAH